MTDMDTILSLLRASEADGFEVTEEKTRGWEFYFIRHKLDQNRIRDVRHTAVRVYKMLDDGKMIGSAQAEISPTATPEEAEKTIRDLVAEAVYVKNPAYRLNRPLNEAAPRTAGISVEETAADFLHAMQEVPETATEDINSYEIFTNEVTRRYLNSEGVDITQVYPSSMLEVVVNARNEDREIELYRMYHSGTCGKEALFQDLADTMRMGRDRLTAVPTPALKVSPVLFTGEASVELVRYFLAHMNAAYKYQKYSDWEIGKQITPDAEGDRLTLRAVRTLPNSSMNFFCDTEGAVIHDRTLIRAGEPENFWGSRQFSEYLGLRDSSIVYNFIAEGGSRSMKELRDGDYLEAAEFSDFQCDPVTGDFAGEIRLAYLHQENEVTPVTGGSVSGSLPTLMNRMYLSRSQRQYDCALIPEGIRLENVSVTGIG